MDAIKYKFVDLTLRNEAKRFKRNQGIAISEVLNKKSGNLLKNRKFLVKGSGANLTLNVEVPAYNRFLDIRNRYKKNRRGQSKRSKGKGLRIYNRFAMGHFFGIGQRLQYGLTQETIDIIKAKCKGGFQNG